ncbi:MAG TPA: hypothetical protein VIV40_21950 [Kofleriaceae bacterium]
MSTVDRILDAVRNQIANRSQEGEGKSVGGGGLLGKLTDIFGRKRASSRPGPIRDVRPASEDPYGDPADERAGRNVRPASEDPYGDPADEPRRRR